MNLKCLLNIFYKFQSRIAIITKKGEIESASRFLADFGVLDDNLIK
jgi:hypothetical protein